MSKMREKEILECVRMHIWALKTQKLPGPLSGPWTPAADCSLRSRDSTSLHWQLSASEAGTPPWPNPGCIGGSKGGHQGHAPPGGPNSFIFMQFSAKMWKIIAILGVGAPPGENPGSATGIRTWLSCPERILGFSAARRVTYDVCDILFGLITRFKHICGCFIVKKHLYMLSTEIISFSTTCTSNKNPHQSETVCPELSDIYNFQDFYQLHFFRFSPWPKTPLKSVNSCQASRSWLTQRYRQNTLVRGTHQSVSRPLRPKREMVLVSVALKFMKLFLFWTQQIFCKELSVKLPIQNTKIRPFLIAIWKSMWPFCASLTACDWCVMSYESFSFSWNDDHSDSIEGKSYIVVLFYWRLFQNV